MDYPNVRCPFCYVVLTNQVDLGNVLEFTGDCAMHGNVRTSVTSILPNPEEE